MIKSRNGEQVDEAAVKEYNETRTDWTGTCRSCGVELRGSISDLRAHTCQVKHGE